MNLSRIVFGARPGRTLVRIGVIVAMAFVTFTRILVPVRAEGISFLICDNRGMLSRDHDFGRADRSRIVGAVIL